MLNAILANQTSITRLDADLASSGHSDRAFKFDLCTTLTELRSRLDLVAATDPVFFYSQPQSLHISLLVPEGVQVPRFEGLRAAGADFFKPAAAVVRRLDACFGSFVEYLKQSGRYDDSIIVLTSDHGDAYGDGNRWGHAYYLAPETVRIPLLIHVPPSLRTGRVWDTDAVALSTDVTPTLYDLLGLRLSDPSGLLGRSLMPPGAAGLPQPPDTFLVQSSYSRVFGLLDGHGEWMYTADVNREKEDFYDLAGNSSYPKALVPAYRLKYRKRLLERMEEVNRFYGRRR